MSMFQVISIALVQWLLLGHRLPWQTWPAAGAMIGGACMVIVPSMGQVGGKETGRGDWGGGAAVWVIAGGRVPVTCRASESR